MKMEIIYNMSRFSDVPPLSKGLLATTIQGEVRMQNSGRLLYS
jgi:hypothetical protein